MKRIIALLLAMVMVFALAACGNDDKPEETKGSDAETNAPENGGETKAPDNSGETFTADLSSPQQGTDIISTEMFALFEDMSNLTDGRLTVNVFSNSTLGNQRDMVNALSAGDVQLILEGSVPVDMFAPEYGFLVAPYLIRSDEHLKNIVENSQIWKDFVAKLEESGITILGTCFRGSRQTAATEELDWSNPSSIIIRMPDVSTYVDAWSAIGCSTQIIGGSEVYSSLQTGVINACEGPYSQMVGGSYNEVCDYLYETNHCFEFYCVYASTKWLDTLPDDLEQQLRDLITEKCADVSEKVAEATEGEKQQLIDAGMKFEEVDTAPLFEAVQPVWEEKFNSGEWASSMDEVLSYDK